MLLAVHKVNLVFVT